ncbi:MAG: bifunctional folylpolyglutamate synthase/dihydrofolate synthase [Candidatus Dormibacteria bacterium]
MPAQAHLRYEAAVRDLSGLGRFGIKVGLDRTRALLAALGHPEAGKRGALVAGTNGKGSTAAFLESILRSAGLTTGMTPSPHLISYTERIVLDGSPVSEADFTAAFDRLWAILPGVVEAQGQVTEFEMLLAMAIGWLGPRCQRLVVEVGMGGRLDSTNVLDLGLAIITNVSLDHTQYLGQTVAEIATEKAGIIKPGNHVITAAKGAALAVIEARAEAVGASLWRLGHEIQVASRGHGWGRTALEVRGPDFEYRDLEIRLPGSIQVHNAALAVAAAHVLGDATPRSLRDGLQKARWPGRLELVSPDLLLDGGHNPAGLGAVIPDVMALAGARPLVLLFAAMADKDLAAMLTQLRRLDLRAMVFTRAREAGSRAVSPELLARMWGGGEVVWDAPRALERARELAAPEGLVFACGSLYLVGELRSGEGA